jgi:hypothetical protein
MSETFAEARERLGREWQARDICLDIVSLEATKPQLYQSWSLITPGIKPTPPVTVETCDRCNGRGIGYRIQIRADEERQLVVCPYCLGRGCLFICQYAYTAVMTPDGHPEWRWDASYPYWRLSAPLSDDEWLELPDGAEVHPAPSGIRPFVVANGPGDIYRLIHEAMRDSIM